MKRVLVLLPVLLLAGCAAPSPDAAYLETVREAIPSMAEVPDADLVELGENVCDTLDDRGFEDGMVEIVSQAKDAGMSAEDAGTIAGAASGAYCPEFADEFP